jgi:WD40 repeat protein
LLTTPIQGGDTLFFRNGDPRTELNPPIARIKPQRGMLALFDHKIWHSGELVAEGQKHVLRSDIIFMNLNPPEIHRERSFQYAHDGYIWCLHQLKNGLIASGGRDSAIRLWNSEGEMVACLNGHYKSVLGLDSSHEILVSVSRDEKICLWNLKTLTLEQKLPSITVSFSTQAAAILCVLVLPDGSFVTGGANHKIQKWSREGQQQGTLIGHEGWVWDIKQIDQNRIVSVSEDGSLCLWSLEAIHELKDRVRGTDPMTALDVCPRSKTVVVGDNKGLVSLWTVSGMFHPLPPPPSSCEGILVPRQTSQPHQNIDNLVTTS